MVLAMVSGCASTTVIRSIPDGAKLYVNGEVKGTTPYTLTDQRIVGSDNHVLLKKDGYEDFSAYFSRDEEFSVGACIGGVFVLFPFLWIMKYKPEHVYELKSINQSTASPQPNQTLAK